MDKNIDNDLDIIVIERDDNFMIHTSVTYTGGSMVVTFRFTNLLYRAFDILRAYSEWRRPIEIQSETLKENNINVSQFMINNHSKTNFSEIIWQCSPVI